MKMLKAFDDLAYARSQAEIPATVTATITLSVRDAYTGRVVKNEESFVMDLGEANYQDVSKYLGELAEAGRLIMQPAPITRKKSTSGSINRGRAENKKLIKWVKDNQVMARSGTPRLAYRTESGKNYYPRWLWEMYDAEMGAADGVGVDRPEQRPADVGNRSSES